MCQTDLTATAATRVQSLLFLVVLSECFMDFVFTSPLLVGAIARYARDFRVGALIGERIGELGDWRGGAKVRRDDCPARRARG